MKRLALMAALTAVSLLAVAAPAHGAFGIKDLDVVFTNSDGSPLTQAGAHPFAMTTTLAVNTVPSQELGFDIPDEEIKTLEIAQIPGLVGAPEATPRCANAVFLDPGSGAGENCPNNTAIGVADLIVDRPTIFEHVAVYNIIPPPGVAAKFGFEVLNVPVTIEASVNPDPPHNVIAKLTNIPQVIPFYRSEVTLWGNPADALHDEERGSCAGSSASCPADVADEKPFLTVPRACTGALATSFKADSWQNPGIFDEQTILTHDDAEPPQPFGFTGCGKLLSGFSASIGAEPTTRAAQSPTGLDFSLDIADEDLTNPTGIAQSDIKKAVVTLPEGMTANPSLAEGLGVCSEADLKRESAKSTPGEGCPEASKIGTIEVETPLLDENVNGALFIAEPFKNPFGSLIALYIVIKNPNLGIVVKQPVEVEPDPATGRLKTIVDEIPQLPFSHFRLHLREGARSPLISPRGCGTHQVTAELTPWADPTQTISRDASFEIITGPGAGACPPGGIPPFNPGFEAGSLNNAAASFSPFHMRLTRRDGDQDMTKFSSVLPPGVVGKLAGVSQCPDGAIAAAKSKSGLEERAAPSCPASSEIGSTLAGAGVGSQLTYVPGKLYLAGPTGGDPLSVVAITPAVAGPFDAGTVVVRVALAVNPVTAEVEADGASSDPIPHILQGIPLNVRDLRVHVDRSQFILNPTSCEPSQVKATLFGSFADVLNPADDVPVALSTRFQAADCAQLGFRPRLSLRLKGGTKRGANPALIATLRPRPGDANIAGAAAILPRSEFLDQDHIRTICTRVQFAADSCPKAAIYGFASATTPLLDFPVRGPVYLRSSSNELPDLVADLRGPPSLPLKFEVVGRTDSIRGGIRNTFEATPDVPVSKFVLRLQGGRKGLLVNSRDICAKAFRAAVRFRAHNGRRVTVRPRLVANCGKKRSGQRARQGR